MAVFQASAVALRSHPAEEICPARHTFCITCTVGKGEGEIPACEVFVGVDPRKFTVSLHETTNFLAKTQKFLLQIHIQNCIMLLIYIWLFIAV